MRIQKIKKCFLQLKNIKIYYIINKDITSTSNAFVAGQLCFDN